jgi:CsoR family transcriptional regulator, copper-sensing transcriptional repressor
MFQTKTKQQQITHRLKIVRGHLDKVIRMVEEKDYCIDILHQSHAIQKALQHIDNLIMEDHLSTCASQKIKEGKGQEAIKEVMEVFRKAQP